MNYAHIYDAFIADRRLKESAHLVTGDYTERHHILPRSLGGGDEPGNLIELLPEDHIRAHVLLGAIHGGSMWKSVTAMMGNRKRYDRAPTRRELTAVALARVKYGRECRGEGHNFFGQSHRADSKAKTSATLQKKGWAFFTNGDENIRVALKLGETPPEGFWKGRTVKSYNLTPEGKARVSAASRTRDRSYQAGDRNPSHRADVKEKISAASKAYSNRPDILEARRQRASGEKNPAKSPEAAAKIAARQGVIQRTKARYFEASGFVGNKKRVTFAEATEWLKDREL